MKCPVCGSELEEGAVFCGECGAKVEAVVSSVEEITEVTETVAETSETVAEATDAITENLEGESFAAETSVAENPVVENLAENTETKTGNYETPVTATAEKPKKKKKVGLIIAIVVVAIILLLLLLCVGGIVAAVLINRAQHPNINLNDYVSVSGAGYDGYGSVLVKFDEDAFDQKYGKLISKREDKLNANNSYAAYNFESDVMNYLYVSNNYKVSNGDVVTLKMDEYAAETIEKRYGVTITHTEQEFVIDSLQPMKKVTAEEAASYINIRFEGYNTVGDGTGYFDYAAFNSAYGTDITEENQNDYLYVGYYSYGDLENGEEVTISWSYYTEQFLAQGIEFVEESSSAKTVVVSGLTELTAIDPFECDGFEIVYEGDISGNAKASLADENCFTEYGGGTFFMAYNYDVSNGDELKVTFSSNISTKDLARQGVCYPVKEKTFVVEGLYEYVSADNIFTKEALEQFDTMGQTLVKDMIASDMSDCKIQKMSCAEVYLAVNNTDYKYYDMNRLYFLYEVTVKGKKETKTFYTYAQFNDLIDAGEEIRFDSENVETAKDNYDSFYKNGQRYYGYEDKDGLMKDVEKENRYDMNTIEY